MDDYKEHFKYKAIKAIIRKSMQLKNPEVVAWRKAARRYLENFEQQFKYQDLPTWKLDDELFDQLQRQAQSLLIDL